MMRTLGITGGIGSGKSAACRILRSLGASLFEADVVAKDLMERSPAVREAIVATFGARSYSPVLNRAWLAAQVFGNAEALARLNAIVHPRVRTAFEEMREKAVQDRVPLLVHEAALIFESGLDSMLDDVAVIDAPVSVRIRRVMDRDGMAEEAVRARMRHQLPPAELKRRADYVIDNGGSLAMLRPQVERLFEWATAGHSR